MTTDVKMIFALTLRTTMKVEITRIQAINQPYMHNDLELQELMLKMMTHMGYFKHFFKSFIQTRTHNMLIIMLDYHLKT